MNLNITAAIGSHPQKNRLSVYVMTHFAPPHRGKPFYSCFSLPRDGEKFQRWTIGQIYEVMKRASPETMRDVKMRVFGKHLALMGVKNYVPTMATSIC